MAARNQATMTRGSCPALGFRDGILLVCSLILMAMIAWQTVLSALTSTRPEAALEIDAGHGEALVAVAGKRLATAGGRIDQATAAMARAAIDAMPLSGEPLAFSALQRGDRLLAEAALRRNPRSRAARLVLFQRAVADRRYKEALAQLDRLIILEPGAREPLFTAMATIAGDPASRPALIQLVDSDPPWRQSFLELLNAQGADPALIFRLTREGTEKAATAAQTAEQSALLKSLVAQGDYERAFLAWVNFLPGSALAHVEAIYDGRFENRPGPGPFNWLLRSNENGTAEFTRPRGIRVDYFGSVPTDFVEQTLLLPRGNYRLLVRGTGSANPSGGRLSWVLSCIGGPELARIGLHAFSDRLSARAVQATVPPAGCTAQRLVLKGEPSDFTAPVTATTNLVAIEATR